MSSSENLTTISTTPTAEASRMNFRRKSVEGDEENNTPRMLLPSPRREPLRALKRDNSYNSFNNLNNSNHRRELKIPPSPCRENGLPLTKNADSHGDLPGLVIGSALPVEKPPLTQASPAPKKPCARTPPKTPLTTASPFAGRTPNEGKILSPLPLLPRRLQSAKKNLSGAAAAIFRDHDERDTTDAAKDQDSVAKLDEDLLELKISEAFDEGSYESLNSQSDSLGWAYTLEDFQFVRKLGSGGSADVYEVLEVSSCELYALKVQPSTEDAICELDLHIPLRHTNICQMIDYFYAYGTKPFVDLDPPDPEAMPGREGRQEEEEDPQGLPTTYLCTILEFCNGGDLHSLIDEHVAVPEDLAAKIIHDAIHALQYLHASDKIHCDIKPANWLVDGKGSDVVIKLADFGMAVSTDAKEIVGGSPVYMAPEHLLAWRNLTDDFDHRTDIYSLGVVLYELLMGYLPYEVLEAEQEQHWSKAPPSQVVEGSSIVQEISALSLAELSKDTDHEAATDECDDIITIGEPLDGENDNGYPVLDLRKLNDATSDQPFYVPPPIFVEEISEEAQDLILGLMEPSASKRITLEEALDHDWFRQFGL